MPLHIRRVVTGHDESGPRRRRHRRGQHQRDLAAAATRELRHLVDRLVPERQFDRARRRRPAGREHGSRRLGVPDRGIRARRRAAQSPHRVDRLCVVLAGEIDMEIDGASVHLRQGDVLVQRGTIHNWNNRGTQPCVIAFVLIAAKPVERAGRVLSASG